MLECKCTLSAVQFAMKKSGAQKKRAGKYLMVQKGLPRAVCTDRVVCMLL